MPFWKKNQSDNKSEGEDGEYNEQPSMISVKSGATSSTGRRNDAEPQPNCCRRLCSELNPCQPWFTTADTFGRKIDIPESFAPASCYAFLWKLAATILTLATLVLTWINTANPEFYLAYFTYWALLLATLYMIFSLYNTVMAARTPQPPVSPGFVIRTTWALATMATHTEACASILYWGILFKRNVNTVDFYSLAPHVIIACVIWFDAFVVNRIPMRWMMWFGLVLPLELLYAIWSVIQSYSAIGNPDVDNASGANADNDEPIYGVLSWEEGWLRPLITTLVAVFGLGPLVFLLMWVCSLYTIPCVCYKDKRKYMDSFRDQDDLRPTVDDVEEGSIFARWR